MVERDRLGFSLWSLSLWILQSIWRWRISCHALLLYRLRQHAICMLCSSPAAALPCLPLQDRKNKDNVLPKLLGGADSPGALPPPLLPLPPLLELPSVCPPASARPLTSSSPKIHVTSSCPCRPCPADALFKEELKKYDDLAMEVRADLFIYRVTS